MAYYSDLGADLNLTELIAKGGPAVQAASKIIQDPALPEVTCNVLRLNAVVEGRKNIPPCARKHYTPAQKRQGVGLHSAVMPLRIATWARQNPALAAGAGIAAVGLLVGVGYYWGKRKR